LLRGCDGHRRGAARLSSGRCQALAYAHSPFPRKGSSCSHAQQACDSPRPISWPSMAPLTPPSALPARPAPQGLRPGSFLTRRAQRCRPGDIPAGRDR